MDEVYTCLCGGQAWTILGDFIVCNKCGYEFQGIRIGMANGTILPTPEVFNRNLALVHRTITQLQPASSKPAFTSADEADKKPSS